MEQHLKILKAHMVQAWAWMVYVAMASLSLGILQWTGSTNNVQAA